MYIITLSPAIDRTGMISPKQAGISLLSTYGIGVELASILLLSGVVGAYYLGRRDASEDREGEDVP